jgi:hypothetical protein
MYPAEERKQASQLRPLSIRSRPDRRTGKDRELLRVVSEAKGGKSAKAGDRQRPCAWPRTHAFIISSLWPSMIESQRSSADRPQSPSPGFELVNV